MTLFVCLALLVALDRVGALVPQPLPFATPVKRLPVPPIRFCDCARPSFLPTFACGIAEPVSVRCMSCGRGKAMR